MSSVSRMSRFFCILRFCVMSWKDESEPNIKYCLGATVVMVQRFITIQKFGHNRRRTNGIRVEYFHKIHYNGACPWSPKVHEQNWRTRTIPRTNYLHVDVQQKDFQHDVGHSSNLHQRQSGLPLTKTWRLMRSSR